MSKKKEIFCTLGPSSLNKKFLEFSKNNIDLLRLNMSHINLKQLKKNIGFIRKFTKVPICIDTEGAQIRTKINKPCKLRLGKKIKISKYKGNFNLYPDEVFNKIRVKDNLEIGFDDLKAKVLKVNNNFIILKITSAGKLENNKGVHVTNRSINLKFLTNKDLKALEIAKELKIKNFALSFTNSIQDIDKFEKLLPKSKRIYKLESKKVLRNISKIIKRANNFLIDRGDLSKEIKIENIPLAQRQILKLSKKYHNKNIYVATNFLESMTVNKYPTRGEANDIYSTLEMGAKGLVLAAETAVGKYPKSSVIFLKKIIKKFN